MKIIFLISIISILNISCTKDFSNHSYIPPEDIGDGLQTGALEEANIDVQMILKASGIIHNGKYGEVHSMLIFKNDMLVFEEYYAGHKYQWDAPHGTSANDIDRIYFECSNDPVKCVLERPLRDEPGENFTYSGGGMIILGEILKYSTGMKFGVMYLKDGVWKDKQIIPSYWVEKSQVIYNNNKSINIPIEDSGKNGYGYTWWISEVGSGNHKTKMFHANGWGG